MGSSMCVKKNNYGSILDSCMICSNPKSPSLIHVWCAPIPKVKQIWSFILFSFHFCWHVKIMMKNWLGNGDIVYLILGLSPFVDSIFNHEMPYWISYCCHEMSYWISYCWRIFNLIINVKRRNILWNLKKCQVYITLIFESIALDSDVW
jgi:hypothetical protein